MYSLSPRIAALFTPLLLAIALLGCNKPAPTAHASSLKRDALMVAVFPEWQPAAEKMVQTVALPMQTNGQSAKKIEQVEARIAPLYVVRLDERHAVLLTHTLPVDNQGEPLACHACSSHVGAYFFTQDNSGWRLSARQDSAVEAGLQGNLGKTEIVRFGEQGYAFTAEWGSCWQGYCGSWLVLLGLQADRSVVLSSGIPVAAENIGAYLDCDDGSLGKPGGDDEPPHKCFQVNGSWKPEGEQLVLQFAGSLRDGAKTKPSTAIRETAVYRIANGHLRLESGKNPVPAI